MKAFKYSTRHVNSLKVLDRLLSGEWLSAEDIRMYDDQGRVIEYINNKLLVPVSRTRIIKGDQNVRAWYLTDQTIDDYYSDRENQYARQKRMVLNARQYRKATAAAELLHSLGESVPESITVMLAANDD